MRMLKGVCVEQKDSRSIFILPNGQFVHGQPATEVAVGEEGYFYPKAQKKKFARKIVWAPVLAAVAIMAIVFSLFAPPEEAYAYVQVQINPGVELGIGEDGQIINFRGLNNDGEKLAAKLKKWENQPLDQVLEKIFSLAVKNNTEKITITTVSEKDAGLPLEAVVKTVSSKTVKEDVEVRLKKATKAQWRKSVKENIPVSQLVSHSTSVKEGKPPILQPKKERQEIKKKEPKKEQKKQLKAKGKREKLEGKLKEPNSSSNNSKEKAPAQKKKAAPKTEEKEKPKQQEKLKPKPKAKEKAQKNPSKAKEAKKKTPAQSKPKEKKKEEPPKAKEKKKEKSKPDAKKKKPKAIKKENQSNKQDHKSKKNNAKKE